MDDAPLSTLQTADKAGGESTPARWGWSLNFAPELERDYRRDHTQAFLPVLRFSIGVIVVFFFAYLSLDYLLFQRYLGAWVYPLILLGASPAALLAILATYHPDYRFVRAVVTTCACGNALALIIAFGLSFKAGHAIPYVGIIVFVYFAYFLLGITHVAGFVIASGGVLGHLVVAYAVGLPQAELFDHAFMMTTVVVLGAISSRLMEISSRRNWMSEQQLQALAERDPLTGLLNQRAFFARADAMLAQARVHDYEVAFILVGLRHLASYNYHLGHPGSDACIRRVGALLMTQVNAQGGIVGSVGGEQFIMLLPQHSAQQATDFRDQLQSIVSEARIPHPGAPQGYAVLMSAAITDRACNLISARAAAQAADELLLRIRADPRRLTAEAIA